MAEKGRYSKFIQAVKRITGRTAEDIRETPICESRRRKEKKGATFNFKSWFPFIGRGNILGDQTISRDEIEAQFDKDLKK